jgi:ABC-type Zn uptake system ZnuABC Zn-binding protein ZnuA
MSTPTTIDDVIKTLRSADPASMYFHSQHMAEVLESLASDYKILLSLLSNLDSVEVENMSNPLTQVRLVSTLPDHVLGDLLRVMADASDV